ncbi:MAG TPA: hypothetical protein H9705_03655 [Candidatus Fusicatenibacter intestinigallinarum]|uniref:Nucleic acid-binding domain protein n=1 Tax=Candidatus Fusicatenibacter intestinigallinarum TaxID=2838598 RepID=A0A9D2NAB7_9FIRM|nr:hypothetical protein [Candidatus Fusicatenibacter intestinigallinarum]
MRGESFMRRKTLSMLLAVSMVVALSGCAGGNSSTSGSSASNVSASSSSVADASSASSASAEDQSGADTASADVLTHEEYMAADLDSEVTIETYVQAKQSWWEDEGQGKATVYGQSEDGAYFMYDMACSQEDYEKLVPGTKIQVTGYKSEWSGEVEIMDGTFEIVDGDEFIATPLDVTEMLGTDELIDHQNELVQFKGLTVEPANPDSGDTSTAFLYNYDGSGSEGDDLYFNASYNGQTYTFVIESYLCDSSTEVYSAVKNLQVGQTIDMEGFLYWYEGVNPHITSVTVVG